jgi:preprotein translocase subunit SecB
MDESQQPGIRIVQIFLESASFAHREDFLAFSPETNVSGEVEIGLEIGVSADGSKGRIRLSATSKPEFESLYVFDIVMTALVEREGEGNMALDRYLNASAGAMVMPFLREAVANLTGRGRFGPLWLKPINLLAPTKQEAGSQGEESTQEAARDLSAPKGEPAPPKRRPRRSRH